MTGTPVANRPYDIWSQIRFLDGGASLGDSFSDFRSGLNLSNDLAADKGSRTDFEERLASIFGRIEAFTVRETKASAAIELPEKCIANITVAMEPQQRVLYERFRTELRAEVVKDGELLVDDAETILKRLLRLVQVASNPALVDESYRGIPGKMGETVRLVNAASLLGEKTIVWTSFVDNAEWLAASFARLGSVVVHGALEIEERNRAIESFKRDADVMVLVATPGAAKEGLTLTVANHAIFFDRSFALDDYLQAQDRIHRISQARRCFIWNLIAAESVDEWVDMLLAAKHLAAQLAQGDIDADEYGRRANYDFGIILRRILGEDADHGDV
jgi:SNF2 family DNA or RNA helicase